MSANIKLPYLGFVWPADLFQSSFQETGEAADILDCTRRNADFTFSTPRRPDSIQYKLSLQHFSDQDIAKQLLELKPSAVWVECPPALTDREMASFLQTGKLFSGTCPCNPIACDILTLECLSRQAHLANTRFVAIKGNEAAGLVSNDTLSTLFPLALRLFPPGEEKAGLVVWGGVARPEATAAFLLTGAAGVVFQSVHWITAAKTADPLFIRWLAKIRPEFSSTVPLSRFSSFRLFNKGNSAQVAGLEKKAQDAVQADDRKAYQFICRELAKNGSGISEPSPLRASGPEASFADWFAETYGQEPQTALPAFCRDIRRHMDLAGQNDPPAGSSPDLNQGEPPPPIIQGAMSCISDLPEFAEAVARQDGLPTIALSFLSYSQLNTRLAGLAQKLAGKPYAVNLIALAENPRLEEQLQWIRENRPPYVVLAAGGYHLIDQIAAMGCRVIFIAADMGMLRLALKAPVFGVILEGSESGGHVGELSTLVLAQAAAQLRQREPDLFANKLLVLAGGVFDRDSARRARIMGAGAIQMGTAYLATREIVETGALHPVYQEKILSAHPGETEITGGSVGLAVRSLSTTLTKKIRALEKQAGAKGMNEQALRRELEILSSGSLYLAARGRFQSEGPECDAEEVLQKGQFMSGASAGLLKGVIGLKQLHQEVRPAGSLQTQSDTGTMATRGRQTRPRPGMNRLAITGMALFNSLGNTPQSIWDASLALQSGIVQIPLDRWDHSQFLDRSLGIPNKTYCEVGAFSNISVDRKDLKGISPLDFKTMSNSSRRTLLLVKLALDQSGLLDSNLPGHRVGAIVSQNSGECGSTMGDMVVNFEAAKIVSSLIEGALLAPSQKQQAIELIRKGRQAPDDTTLLGRLNSSAAGFICNQYGFSAPSFAVSAACATGLVALFNAMQIILSGRADAMVVGGAEELLHPGIYVEFSALGALAGLKGNGVPLDRMSRPFDLARDGFVLGEGGGALVVEREETARARGARILALVTGMGASNSTTGMVESDAESQARAIRTSFRQARYGPETVDLVECHATSTMQGDVEEVRALSQVFPSDSGTYLAAFKSQIGHTLGASGLNSMVRGVMALCEGVIPPTINYTEPDPEIALEQAGFRVAPEPLEWRQPAGRPRRLQVNAFGFGGVNYVVQLEQARNGQPGAALSPGRPAAREPQQPQELSGMGFHLTGADAGQRLGLASAGAGRFWLEELAEKYAAGADMPTVGQRRKLASKGVFLAPADQNPDIAMVFSGQGTFYPGMGRQLYERFPSIKKTLDQLAGVLDFDLLELMFKSPTKQLRQTRWQQPALFALETAVADMVRSLGLAPRAMAGHSLGELSALCQAGVFSASDGLRLVNKRGQCMAKAADLAIDPGVMLATDAPREVLDQVMEGKDQVFFTNFNSPRQTVLGGNRDQIVQVEQSLQEQGFWTRGLKVSMAFHSPIMSVIREEMQEFIATIPMHAPQIPVVSNTTGELYPDDEAAIKKIIMAHLECPVHWVDNVTTLWNDFGIRHYMEVGPKDTLCGFISDTFQEADCLNSCHPDGEPQAFGNSLAWLYSLGGITPQGHGTPPPLPIAPSARPSRHDDDFQAIVQDEVNHLLLERFGDFLKPAILRAVQKELDPTCDLARLENMLAGSLGKKPQAAPALIRQASPAAPLRQASPNTLRSSPDAREAAPLPEHIEKVIAIIMDATGYERDEIEPDMDLRQDLAIRSSRMPVIVAALEEEFAILIRLEDFLDIRTVRDLADRVQQLSGNGQARPKGEPIGISLKEVAKQGSADAEPQAELQTPPNRYLVSWEKITWTKKGLHAPSSPGPVCLVGFNLGPKVGQAAEWFKHNLGLPTIPVDLAGQAGAHTPEIAAASGLVFLRPEGPEADSLDPRQPEEELSGCFDILRGFVTSPAKSFCLALTWGTGDVGPRSLFQEGLTGVLQTLGLEYGSLLCRGLLLDKSWSLDQALALGLAEGQLPIDLYGRNGEVFTRSLVRQGLSRLQPGQGMARPGQVAVLSGGAKGVTSRIALSLAGMGCPVVLLGRTEPASDSESAAEIAGTVQGLQGMGAEYLYIPCDVGDPAQAAAAMKQVADRFGRVDILVHGAGVIADAFAQYMPTEVFRRVVDVKLTGAWNLVEAARDKGLSLIVGLSSLAAFKGNPGQSNYCCGNRAMAELFEGIQQRGGPRHKIFWLPPVSGTGLADSPEVRALLEYKGLGHAFVPAAEVAEFICRDLFLPSEDQSGVAFSRPLNYQPGLDLSGSDLPAAGSSLVLAAGDLDVPREEMPLVDQLVAQDLQPGLLIAQRSFRTEKDLWLSDHRPYLGKEEVWLPGAAAIEAMVESARLMRPAMIPTAVQDVRFLAPFSVKPGQEATLRMEAALRAENSQETVCAVKAWQLTPDGTWEQAHPGYAAKVILCPHSPKASMADGQDILGNPATPNPKAISEEETRQWYRKATAFGPRYQVLRQISHIDGSQCRSLMEMPLNQDVDGLGPLRYHVPIYILEGILQSAGIFCMQVVQPSGSVVPFSLDRVRIYQQPEPGREIRLVVRLTERREVTTVFSAQAIDPVSGLTYLAVEGLAMADFQL